MLQISLRASLELLRRRGSTGFETVSRVESLLIAIEAGDLAEVFAIWGADTSGWGVGVLSKTARGPSNVAFTSFRNFLLEVSFRNARNVGEGSARAYPEWSGSRVYEA